jgi:hypothetical protein
MEKLNTCRILKEKSFATKPLQRKRKTIEVILQIKMDPKEILKGELQLCENSFRNS